MGSRGIDYSAARGVDCGGGARGGYQHGGGLLPYAGGTQVGAEGGCETGAYTWDWGERIN